MADTLGGFNLQSAGFADLVQTAIYRNAIRLLRTAATYALPESVLALARKDGNNMEVRATLWTDVAPDLSPLAEGVPPAPTKMAEDQVEASITEVGGYIPIFSQANYQLAGLVEQAVNKVGRQVYLAFDTLARNLYEAYPTNVYAGAGNAATGDVDTGDVLTTDMVDELVTIARESDLEPFSDGLYRIVGHPRLFRPLLQEAGTNGTGFAPAANQGTAGDLVKGTIGDYHGARFISAGSRGILLPNEGTSSTDVYKGVLIGRQSIALTDLSSIETHVDPGGGPTDPLHQIIATVAWKGFIGGVVVDLANFSDGAGNLDAPIQRSVLFEAAGI